MNDSRLELTIEVCAKGRLILIHRNGEGIIIDTRIREYLLDEVARLINEKQIELRWLLPTYCVTENPKYPQ
jgi:hypothetical protein